MYMSSYKIRQFIHDTKNRYRMRALRQGASLLIFTFLFFALLFFILEYKFDFSPFFRGLGISIALIFLLYVLIQFIARPFLKRLDDQKIALLIEEKIPDLEDRLNSAVEINEKHLNYEKNVIIDKLIDDTIIKTKRIELSTVVDLKKEKILSYVSGALLLIFFIFFFSFYNEIKSFSSKLNVTFNPISEFEQDFLTISPGNIEIEKGEAQDIIVEMKFETEEDVTLHFDTGDENWREVVMEKGIEKSVYIQPFLDIQNTIKYRVEHNQKSSEQFAVSIYEFPKVTKIDLKYDYPKYTDVPTRTEENTGDIYGLKGSKVTLMIETNGTAVSGEMALQNENKIQLKSMNDGKFNTTIMLEDTGSYHIKLTDASDKNNKFPEEYDILPVNDEQPIIRITEPQRDIRANMVDEILIETSVTDDYGIEDFKLKYSINGEDEKEESLISSKSKGEKDVASSHMLFLEDFGLQAGDVISYYVEAKDNCESNDNEYSDMYFIEVSSLENRYTQVSNQGSGGGGGGNQSKQVMTQQKIIAATWKLEKTKKNTSKSDFNESLDAIKKAQTTLKGTIEERVNQPQPPQLLESEEKNEMDYLKNAVKEMDEALEELDQKDLKNAVKEEQQALNNLLRAEALNNEKRVQQQQRGNSSGGGSNVSQDRMNELQDLELDLSKEKYETQQQRQQEQQNQEVDEALKKLEELARRQERLAQQSQQNLQEESEKRFLDRLKRDQEELRRETENLANQMRQQSRENQQFTQQDQERLQNATENMRNAEEALNNNNPEEALSQQQMAINELNRLKQDLQLSQLDNYRERTDNFVDNFEQLKQQEKSLEDDLSQVSEDYWRDPQGRIKASDVERLKLKRENTIEDLKNLENQAESLEQSTKRENPEISTTMKNFQRFMERDQLERQMEYSKTLIEQGHLTSAQSKEYRIQESLDRLSEQVRKLEDKLPMTEEEQLNRSLRDVKDLLQRYDEITNIARQQMQSEQSQRSQQQGNESQNRENQGQSGQQQNQQNQQNSQQGGGNRGQREQTARLQRQMDSMQQQLDNLTRGRNGNQNTRSAMESMRNDFGRLHNTGVLLDEAALDYFKQKVFNPLSKLELELVQKLDEVEMEKKLHSVRKAEVPPQYRKIVEKYYETISKSKTEQSKNKRKD